MKTNQAIPKQVLAIIPLKNTNPGKLTELTAFFQYVLLMPNEIALNNPKMYEINDYILLINLSLNI